VISGFSLKALALTDYAPANKQSLIKGVQDSDAPVQVITVKFKDEFKFRMRNEVITALPPKYNGSLLTQNHLASIQDSNLIHKIAQRESFTIMPTFSGQNGENSENALDAIKSRGETRSQIKLADLNNFYSLILPAPSEFADVASIVEEINALDTVEIAYAEPEQKPTTINVAMPNVAGYQDPSINAQGSQGYLSNSSNGIHAQNGWVWKGGRGNNVVVGGIDENIYPYHIELNQTPWSIVSWPSTATTQESDHGNAIMGVMVAKDDAIGVTGVVPEVPMWRFESNEHCFIFCWNDTGRAMGQLLQKLNPGDVISVSWGWNNNLPAEAQLSMFAATQTAVANGLVVVTSAGNGNLNLDDPVYGGAYDLNVRDSGAIIVGAVEPDGSNGTMYFTNYGSRVTARAWGSKVATIGYNNPIVVGAPWGERYTAFFDGTSAAAPIVAGAAASIQSIA
jgi:serine protease